MIKERIIQVIESKGIAKESFYVKIGMTSANFRGEAKKRPINSNAIENILSEIPDLNSEWLVTGKGSMLKEGNPIIIDEPNPIRDKLILRQDQLIEHLEKENRDLKKQLLNLKKDKESSFHPKMVAESGKKLEKKHKNQN